MAYLDHAATSWPKAPGVADAMRAFLDDVGATPGRSGHRRSVEAARLVFGARQRLATLLGAPEPRQVLFTPGATHGLNLVLAGWLRPGDHVVVTSLEHNALMRPLRALVQARGLAVTVVPGDAQGQVDPGDLRRALRPGTRLVAVNHGSNVSGTLQDLAAVRAAIGDAPLLVDGAQTVGARPLDVGALGVDFLAFSGHKALGGPPGIGGLYLAPGRELDPLVRGGTGSRSEHDEQPAFLPDRYEGGTPNTVGIAGLDAALRWLEAEGLLALAARETRLFTRLWQGAAALPGVRLLGPPPGPQRLPTLSLTVAGADPADLARRLDRRFDVATRPGLHCAPQAHRSLGTFPVGTLRLSLGHASTDDDVDRALEALAHVVAEVAP